MLIYLLIVFFSVLIGYQLIVKNREGMEGSPDALKPDALKDHDDLIIMQQELKQYKPLITKPDGEPTMLLSRITKLENEVSGLITQSKNKAAENDLRNNMKAQDIENKKKEEEENKADKENRKRLAKIGNENGE